MDCILEIESLTAGYGEIDVVENVNLKVYENDFIGVIGPNGGGKTTLLKVILGLLKPRSGRVIFHGGAVNRTEIGYLPQNDEGDIGFPVTVKDVVLSGLMINKGAVARMTPDDRKLASVIIDELGLGGMENRTLGELSGGQRQRVFLGRAVIGSPKLLLLDEPVNFVDTEFEMGFYEKLTEFNSKMAILMVSHDVGTISSHVKSFACVNKTLIYHPSGKITNDQLKAYGCPIQLVAHGDIPHVVLEKH
ncbi:MAG: metal ABC transporter ATP-binding protein [Bacteroidales bacterium]|jgi:zinc transport system ATP-binding protein|nr:metal ABC transporter ATP-binding protein [Bacteroidales bacterium]